MNIKLGRSIKDFVYNSSKSFVWYSIEETVENFIWSTEFDYITGSITNHMNEYVWYLTKGAKSSIEIL